MICIDGPLRTGLLKVGVRQVGTLDHKHDKSMWEVYGKVILNGTVSLGSGCRISVGTDAILTLGDNFSISGRSSIICQKEISFGDNCLLSWDILIMDTDFHKILDSDNKVVNLPDSILIGNHVWIRCRSTILKGVHVEDDIVIAAGSFITRSLTKSNSIYGVNGRILKEQINWNK